MSSGFYELPSIAGGSSQSSPIISPSAEMAKRCGRIYYLRKRLMVVRILDMKSDVVDSLERQIQPYNF